MSLPLRPNETGSRVLGPWFPLQSPDSVTSSAASYEVHRERSGRPLVGPHFSASLDRRPPWRGRACRPSAARRAAARAAVARLRPRSSPEAVSSTSSPSRSPAPGVETATRYGVEDKQNPAEHLPIFQTPSARVTVSALDLRLPNTSSVQVIRVWGCHAGGGPGDHGVPAPLGGVSAPDAIW
jgi:hypothetical protein